MSTLHPKRILALDVHPLSFGFVVLEGREGLLDWGVRSFRHGVNAVRVPMSRKLVQLLDEYQPDVLVVKKQGSGISPRMKKIMRSASDHHVRVCEISAGAAKSVSPQLDKNKYQMALAVADHFPLLASHVPPKRKLWKSEHYRTSVFEAAALGLVYFALEIKNDNPKR